MLFDVHIFGVVVPELVWREAPYPRFHQVRAHVMIDRDRRYIPSQQIFCLLVELTALLRRFRFRRVHQCPIVVRIAVLSGVLAIPGTEGIQEGCCIVVIGNPGVAYRVKVMGVHGIKHGFPLLILQLRLHAEVLLPH